MSPPVAGFARPGMPTGRINQYTAGQVIARHLPEGAILADEGATATGGTMVATVTGPPHEHMPLTGGSIGQGIPLATGAAVACPDRKVVCIQGDGGAMYTIQALWTQAREKLDVTTVIFSNRKYQILIGELANVGANPGRTAMDMLDLGNPDLNWPGLANAMGIEAARTDTAEGFTDLLASSLKRSGPFLIELLV
jgi:acetolactate synthase-1/2/3 large subunit